MKAPRLENYYSLYADNYEIRFFMFPRFVSEIVWLAEGYWEACFNSALYKNAQH